LRADCEEGSKQQWGPVARDSQVVAAR
jgi:hypothetical protein